MEGTIGGRLGVAAALRPPAPRGVSLAGRRPFLLANPKPPWNRSNLPNFNPNTTPKSFLCRTECSSKKMRLVENSPSGGEGVRGWTCNGGIAVGDGTSLWPRAGRRKDWRMNASSRFWALRDTCGEPHGERNGNRGTGARLLIFPSVWIL